MPPISPSGRGEDHTKQELISFIADLRYEEGCYKWSGYCGEFLRICKGWLMLITITSSTMLCKRSSDVCVNGEGEQEVAELAWKTELF